MCLAKFAVTFDVASNWKGDINDCDDEVTNGVAGANGSSSNNNANNLDRSKHASEQIKLKDNLGFMRKRRQETIHHTRRHKFHVEPEKYYHGSSSNNNANNLDRSKHASEQIKLKDNLGYMRKRRQEAIHHTRRHKFHVEPEKYYHSSSSNNNANNLDRSKHASEQIKLKDNLGYMRKRRQEAIHHTRRHKFHVEPEKYYHAKHLLRFSIGVEKMSSYQDLLHILSHI